MLEVADQPARRTELSGPMVDVLTGSPLTSAVAAIGQTDAGISVLSSPNQAAIARQLFEELRRAHPWRTERWVRRADGTLAQLSATAFAESEPAERLSDTDCVYAIPAADAQIRAYQAVVHSAEVCAHFSAAYGEPLRCLSAEVARLRAGQYLRRHSDLHERRRFALVLFLSPDWVAGHGGELFVEAPSGEVTVVRPIPGQIALIRIEDDFQHGVCAVRTPDWTRYSIAAHYGIAED